MERENNGMKWLNVKVTNAIVLNAAGTKIQGKLYRSAPLAGNPFNVRRRQSRATRAVRLMEAQCLREIFTGRVS